MRTSFTPDQLADPGIADANAILRACVHCGFCNATCPTYMLLGDELDGPRGRIYLIKEMLEQDRAPVADEVLHIDRCLSCLACMTTCPSGVNYMHLVDHARHHIESNFRRPWAERLARAAIGRVLPDPALFRPLLALARLFAPLARLLPGAAGRMARMTPEPSAASPIPEARAAADGVTTFPAEGARLHRVALLAGCVQRTLAPAINAATIRLLTRHGCEVLLVSEPACCGAMTTHLGQGASGRASAAAMVRALFALIETGGLDAIISNASGCGTMIKDYGHLFQTDPDRAGPAERISGLARDISEFVADIGLRAPVIKPGLAVAYQSACSLRHGQKVTTQPISLLRQCGFIVTEPAESHICCGSAGTYNILQGAIADRLCARKADSLAALKPEVVASGNIGCMIQLGAAVTFPVFHTVELLDWATGGPCPPALEEMNT
ncbi:MAG: glycolate oxidase subunit GlcF [Alphaproteobacteria bacterium]